MLSQLKRWRKDVDSLLKAGLWHDEKGHYQQHDYCVMQRTASDSAEIRSANKERQRKSRLSQPAGLYYKIREGTVQDARYPPTAAHRR